MKNKKHLSRRELVRDIGIIVISIVTAILLVKSGLIEEVMNATKDAYLLGSFVAGFFFTSAFTTPLAVVALIEIAEVSGHPLLVALVGALGGLLGDLCLFLFIRDSFGENLRIMLESSKWRRWSKIFHLKLFRWITPLIGGILIASPLPTDELGLAMMGLSKTKTALLVPISYSMNFLGILFIVLVFHF